MQTELQLAKLLGECFTLMVRGPPLVPQEADVSKLLDSQLFAKGVRKTTHNYLLNYRSAANILPTGGTKRCQWKFFDGSVFWYKVMIVLCYLLCFRVLWVSV